MQVVLVKGNKVVQAYEGQSVESLTAALGTQGGEYHENPEGKPLGAWWIEPEPEPASEPELAPPTLEQVRSQLNRLRRQTATDYVDRWGDLSEQKLWPLLDAEMVRAAGETAETLNPDQYPAIIGFLVADGKPTIGPAVYAAAGALRQHKAAHVAHLRRGELLRERLLAEYAALTDSDKLAWDAATAWTKGVAAWA